MAVAIEHGVCVHCKESIALRVYANGSWSKDNSVKLWTSGNGKFPGDQRFCDSHIIDDEGSIGNHEPVK